MKLDRVQVIARRELAAITKSRAVWLPMVIVPAMLLVLVPGSIALLPQFLPFDVLAKEAGELFAMLPDEMRARLPLDKPAAALVQVILRQMLAPLFVIVPVMTATLVAADAFAGERERKTLEALLHSPATDLEIFAGKALGAFVPALAVCVVGLAVVSVVVDVAAWPLVHAPLLPDPLWLAMALLFAPGLAGLAVLALVFISARVRGFQEANQLGGLYVLPIVALMVSQATGVTFLSPLIVAGMGVALLTLDVVLVFVVGRAFRREDLFLRL